MEKVGTEPKNKSREAETPEPVASVYKVTKGDTLLKIAAKHHTEVSVLLKQNGMKLNDPLFAGRVLKIAISDGDRKDRKDDKKTKGSNASQALPSPAIHKVKKGETLGKIAVQYRTKMSILMKLNNLKLHDPLYVDSELKLPKQAP
jgi:LysM repeat protein